jgi:glycosyltransferase involved in cell wall biosynthesis
MKVDQKTLVIMTPAFPKGESETYWVPSQQLFVKSLKKNFPDLNIIVLAYLYPAVRAEYSWNNIQVKSFDGIHYPNIQKLILFNQLWKSLKKIRKENKLTGILSFWCREGALIGKWFSKRYKLKHISWICGQDARKENKLVSYISPCEDELAAMSDFLANEFKKNHGIRPKYIVENAIDPELFPAETKERDIDILGVGSFEPLKHYDVFAEVINSVKSKFPGVKAFHCGIGREEKKIRALIKEFGLENNFTLLGGKTHKEVLQLMQRTKVFLHPSSYEGFSTVCLEAIYSGARVISFTRPMHSEIKNWNVVKSKQEMVEKSLEFLSTKQLVYERVLIYSMDDTAKAMMSLFQ